MTSSHVPRREVTHQEPRDGEMRNETPDFVSLILDGWMDGWHLDNESHLDCHLG